MRPAFAVLLALVFSVLFVVALLVSRVVNTAGEPSEIAGILDDADLYDFAYDRVLDAALIDLIDRGFTVDTGLNGPETLEFEDPAQARAAIKGFIETVLPREYVKQKVEAALDGVIPYASGRQDSFEIDFETSERIRSVSEAVRVASDRIGMGELVVSELLVPTVRELSDSITSEGLGIELTPDEAEDAARRILPPEYIEQQIFSFFDQTAPYFAGAEDELNVVINFRDRVPIAGQVLKDKLNDEDTLLQLVFERVVDPLVASQVADSTVLVFGIEITEPDIQEAVEIVAPADWVRSQGDGVIDAVVAWLVGATDELQYTIDLEDRKAEAAVELEKLALRKLDEQVAATPVCQNSAQSGQALNDALSGVFPACLPSNASEVVDVMRPLISNEIRNVILTNIPDQVAYSDADLRAQLGADSVDTLDNLRDLVIDGVEFTEQDIIDQLAPDGDTQSVADARETLDIVRAGFVFDQLDITERMGASQLTQFNEARNWINMGWTFRWLIFLPAILLLAAVAFMGGRGWLGRAKWAGAPVAVVAIIFFAAIQVGWASTVSIRDTAIPDDILSAENRADYPTLAALVDNGEFQNMAERVGSAWISGLAMSAVPWAVGGLLLFAIGILYPRYRDRLPQSLGGPGGDPGPEQNDFSNSAGSYQPKDPFESPAEESAEPGQNDGNRSEEVA